MHLVLSHHHHDHSGGIRAYAAIGAELIVAEGDRDFITQCLARPHTIRPDTLAGTQARPTIRTVGDDGLIVRRRRPKSTGFHRLIRTKIWSCMSQAPSCCSTPTYSIRSRSARCPPPPPYWLIFSRDFRRQVEALNLDIELLLGAHGALEGRPYQSFVDFTE